ncbi:hypothetical protein GCWU000341_00257 [Oribacterium sp. oral taxon 078 str. F0262]|nr:hypothetical protein GCWU000341_00257 [Oribacterium sp. oral taxon 078 str. F0262]
MEIHRERHFHPDREIYFQRALFRKFTSTYIRRPAGDTFALTASSGAGELFCGDEWMNG